MYQGACRWLPWHAFWSKFLIHHGEMPLNTNREIGKMSCGAILPLNVKLYL